MNPTDVSIRGIHRREAWSARWLARSVLALRPHGLWANAVALVLAVLTLTPQVPQSAVLIAGALIVVALLGPPARTWQWSRLLPVMALALGWGLLAAQAPQVGAGAAVWMLVAWLSLLPLLSASRPAALLWSALAGLPLLFEAYAGAADWLSPALAIAALMVAGHVLMGQLIHAARQAGRRDFDALELDAVAQWLNKRSAAPDTAPERALRELCDGLDVALVRCTADGILADANLPALRLLGLPASAALGGALRDHVAFLPPGSGSPLDPLACVRDAGGVWALPTGTRMVLRGGKPQFNVAGVLHQLEDGLLLGLRDLTERWDTERMLEFRVSHDPVTGLPGRGIFEARVNALSRDGGTHALVLLEIGGLRWVTDMLGATAGDALRREVAHALHAAIGERGLLAQLSDDQFGLLLAGHDLDTAHKLAQALCGTVKALANELRPLDPVAGVAAVDGTGAEACISAAAQARRLAADHGGHPAVRRFDRSRDAIEAGKALLAWSQELRAALAGDRLALYFQPIGALGDDPHQEGSHGEVLLRLNDDQGRLWAPEQFMGAAEQHGLMPALDRWVVSQVLRNLVDPDSELAQLTTCAVNLSGQSLSEPAFRTFLLERMAEHPQTAARICFEVTEAVVVEDIGAVANLFEALRALGCRIAIDDFGAGHSSFGYLRRLPADYLKIDGSFVRDMLRDDVEREMVDAINRMAHRLGMMTVAEYVQDDATRRALGSMGVDFGQGDQFGPARPLAARPVAAPDPLAASAANEHGATRAPSVTDGARQNP